MFQHTFVLPLLLGELLIQPHVYPKTKNGLAALGAVGLVYLSWYVKYLACTVVKNAICFSVMNIT